MYHQRLTDYLLCAGKRAVTIACCMTACIAATAQDIRLTDHISSADGLSNDFVISMAVDGRGYVWVATEAGVNRIAGKTCLPLTNDDWHDRLNGRITALYWHKASNSMLIGTERGLTIYNVTTGDIRQLDKTDGLALSSVNDIAEAADGGVWLIYGNGQVQHFDCTTFAARDLRISSGRTGANVSCRCGMDDGSGHLYIGYSQHGMTVVDISTGTAHTYQQQTGNNVRRIYRDREGRVWVGTDTGLARFHPETGQFTKVTDGTDRYDDNVYDIRQMADGTLWVATDIGGVRIVGHGRYSDATVKLSSLHTRSIIDDEYGNIWVGNHGTGVDFISRTRHGFDLLDYKDPEGGGRSPVCAMAADSLGGLWMASENELAWWYDGRVKGRWSILSDMRRRYVFTRCMMADRQGGVWLGIDDQGAYRFDRRTNRFEAVTVGPAGSDIHTFTEAKDGRIWIGGETGIFFYQNAKATDSHSGKRAVRHEALSRMIHAPATSMIETAPHQLLITTLGDGIYSVNTKDNSFRHLNISDGLPSSKINHALRCQTGTGVWLATDGGLVHVDDPIGLAGIRCYSKGLRDSHIMALQQDTEGNIWMSSYSGISCFVVSTQQFYNYNHHDTGLSAGFANGAAVSDGEGNIYFGSAGGVCYVNPLRIGTGEQLSEIQIIQCEAYNPVGSHTERQWLTPDERGLVETTYRQNTIRLTFAMRDYAQNTAVDYSYRMKGMDDKWYDIGNDHDVVFRGLRPGQYTFILRAKLRSQNWEQAKETRLTISISPPWWRTWWAYVAYALLAAALAGSLTRSYERKLTLHNALELERRDHQQKQEMNEERLRFFTNITHELRTPLTLILGPIDDLMADENLPLHYQRRIATIQKSAERLRGLINDILEFRKTETQNRRLTVARGDIGQFVREICLNYKALNRHAKVDIDCHVSSGLPEVWFDSEVITTVMNNLLSNAVKYTDKGSITTTVDADNGHVRIAVADTGYGIAAEALPHVFERYYQAKGSHQASGTGIGLALVKSLAELHEGHISAESREGQGSRFTLTLDIGNTYPNALHKEDGSGAAYPNDADTQMKTLLVVEDNADIRQYITDTFCDDFRILEAENGEEGVDMAREYMPDIIVSDIMMPKKNGIELTRQLKGDIRSCHIPIILLTAKTTDNDKEVGYDSGADSYLTKPFTAKLLASRIRNLLTARQRLTEMLRSENLEPTAESDHADRGLMEDSRLKLSHLDQTFIHRLNQLIEANIMQENIDMAFVTDKMAMSHSTFYRKVKALTGMTATEYIRKRRLHHCYMLLKSGDYNVNQAAMMTGFNQMAHFRETFKKEFGILPSDVNKKGKSKNKK